jgi:uncharacterized protein
VTRVTIGSIREFVADAAKLLVDEPDAIHVEVLEGSEVTVLELRARPEDLGRVIGRQGRIVNAMRTLLHAAGMKLQKRFILEVVADQASLNGNHNSKFCRNPFPPSATGRP